MSLSALPRSWYASQERTASSNRSGAASSSVPEMLGDRQNEISLEAPLSGLPSGSSATSSGSKGRTTSTTRPHQHEPHRLGARPGSITSSASSEGCGGLGSGMVGEGYQG